MNQYLEKFVKETFKKPGVALDFGCGKGYDVACLAWNGWKVKGVDQPIDLSQPYVNHEQVDLVYSNYTLPFIKDKKQFAANIFNNLKPGGWLFVMTFSVNDKGFLNKGQTQKELKLLFSIFENIEVEPIKYYDNDFGHQHWHELIQLTAQKGESK